MKTLTIDIQDSFLKEFLNFVQKNQNKILVRNSSDYEDIYFDDRKKQLQKIREDIKDGKEKLYSIDEFEKRFDLFEKVYIIYEFISKDKLSAAQNFKKELLKTIKALSDFPLKYRKSYYFDDENIRDLTFKGYTIVYEVDFDKKEIFVFHIFNKNLPINIKKENENDSY